GWLPKHFVSWAELVLTIAKDPRPSVAATSGMFWTAILQHTNLARLQTVTKTIPAVLGVYMQHWLWAKVTLDNLSKRGRHAEYPEEDTTWSSLDEYKSFISSGIRNRAQRIFSLIAILDIAGMNRWLYERLAETIRALSATAQSLDEALAGNIDAKNQAVVILEMTRHTSMELKSKKVHAVEVGDEELSEELDRAEASLAEMLTLICQLQTIHPEVVQHICSAFVSFAFILKDPSRHDLLNAVLQKLSGYVQQLLSSSNRRDGHEPMPLDYSSVEIRGLSTLISLAEEIPDEMIKFYNEWAKLIAMAPSVPSRYASVFRRMVIELHLAMASQGSLSVSDRQKMARPAMEQVVLLWRESTGGISTPVGLLDLLGVPELDTMHCDTGEDGIVSLEAWVRFCDTKIQTVSQLHQAAEMLYMALKRTVGDPRTGGSSAGGPPAQVRIRDSLTVWSEFIPELVPSLLLLVRCLHALWNTRVYWDGLPWKSQAARTTEDRMGVLGLPPDERGQIIRNLVATADGPHTSSAEPAESKQQHKLLASLRSQNVGHLATPQEREAFIVRARGAVSRHICQGISSVLTVLYKCLGILCKMPQVYQLPGLGESFVGSMFSDIHYLPLQHMGHMLARAVYQILDNMAGEVADSFVSELLPPLFEFMRARIHGEWLGLQERGLTLTSKSELEELAASGTAAADEGDVSEDIIQEKIVRTWTYQWAKIIGLLLGKLRNLYPPTDALAADLRHESEVLSPPVAGDKARALQLQAAIRATDADDLWNRVGRLFMSSPGLMGGLLGCVAQMVTVKDTPSVHATLTNLAAVIPPLLVSALSFDYEPATGAAGRQRDRPYLGVLSAGLAGPVLSWLSTDLPSSVMAMLQDPYFTDHYSLGITILGDLAFYSSAFRGTAKWRLRAGHTEGTESDPHYVFKREFIGALGRRTGCDEARLARLFDLWTDEADTKSRRALGRVEFEGFMGVDKGQIFKYSEGTQTGHGAASAKTIAFNLPNQSGLSGSTKTTKKNVGGSGGELFEQDSDFSLNSVMP
ncbi:karyopherin, partial [Spiromyces aspiralis]